MDKLIPLIGIIFLCLVGLSGSEDILSKKRAWLSIIWTNIRQAKGMVEKGRAKWRSHPLIHTFQDLNLTQNIEGIKHDRQ